jgi:integrase/recombinase XerD
VQQKRALLADLSGWLEAHEFSLDSLDEAPISQFHARHHQRGIVRRGAACAFTVRQLIRYLRDIGCISAPAPNPDLTPIGELTGSFGRFLSTERGLSPATLVNYLPIARRFLVDRFGGNALRLALWLGHESVENHRHLPAGQTRRFRPDDQLMAFLRSL